MSGDWTGTEALFPESPRFVSAAFHAWTSGLNVAGEPF